MYIYIYKYIYHPTAQFLGLSENEIFVYPAWQFEWENENQHTKQPSNLWVTYSQTAPFVSASTSQSTHLRINSLEQKPKKNQETSELVATKIWCNFHMFSAFGSILRRSCYVSIIPPIPPPWCNGHSSSSYPNWSPWPHAFLVKCHFRMTNFHQKLINDKCWTSSKSPVLLDTLKS